MLFLGFLGFFFCLPAEGLGSSSALAGVVAGAARKAVRASSFLFLSVTDWRASATTSCRVRLREEVEEEQCLRILLKNLWPGAEVAQRILIPKML